MKNNKKGSTLVECLVAMLVISIITTAGIGVFHSAIESTNKQWGKYSAALMAENALACFQSADNMDDFEIKYSELSKDGNKIGSDDDNLWINAQYNELELSGAQATEVKFDTVRAYESGKTDFLKNDETVSSCDYSENKSKYTEDKAILSDSNGIYKVNFTQNEEGGINKIQYTLSGMNGNNKKYSFVIVYDYLDANSNKSSDLYVHITCNDTKVTEKATDFEKFLFSRRYVLLPFKYGYSFNTGNKMTCYVSQISEDGKTVSSVLDSNRKWVYYAFEGSVKNYSSASWSANTDYTVSVTRSAEKSSDYQSRKNTTKDLGDGKEYTSFTWKHYPVMAFNVAWNNSNPSSISGTEDDKPGSVSNTSVAKASGSVIYTDYVLKNQDLSQVNYVLYKSDSVKIYGPSDTLLYSYTGSKVSDVWGNYVTKFDFVQIKSYGTDGTDASGYKKYAPLKFDGIKMNRVAYDETAHSIKFMNGTETIVSYDYGDNVDAFNKDKPTENEYAKYYSDKNIINPDDFNISVQRVIEGENKYYYQIALVEAEDKQTVIFQTGYGNLKTVEYASFSNVEKTKTIRLDGSAVTQFYYCIAPGGDVGCYIMVTYSRISSLDMSVEPRIKAWILSKSDIERLKEDPNQNKTQNEILKANKCYISYRKG